ncbi:hypothetical protein HDV01_007880 [Terramyces sp. JEL0728]|nr:hypothetical protein HDV01_007880 [Terramyces sp. JEL0728]
MTAQFDCKKLVLLIDWINTFCYSTETKIPDCKPDMLIKGTFIYLRSDIETFLSALAPYFNLCIYSATDFGCILPVVHALNQPHICNVFDQSFTKKDPHALQPCDTIRDDEKILESLSINQEQLVILENDIRNFHELSDNGILVPKYKVDECMKKSKQFGPLQTYLTTMGKEYLEKHFDVRQYMGSNQLHDDEFGAKTVSTHKSAAAAVEIELKKLEISLDLVETVGNDPINFEQLHNGKLRFSSKAVHITFDVNDKVEIDSSMNVAQLWNAVKDIGSLNQK